MLGVEAEGKEIKTVEGIADGEDLHPLQQKFIDHVALQCVFAFGHRDLVDRARPVDDELQRQRQRSGRFLITAQTHVEYEFRSVADLPPLDVVDPNRDILLGRIGVV